MNSIARPPLQQQQANGTRHTDRIAEFLAHLHRPGDVFEVRIPHCPEKPGSSYTSTWSGYFNDTQAAAESIARIDREQAPPAIYVTLNPVDPVLLARAHNRIKSKAKATTADVNVPCRRHIIIDLDPVRPPDVSSTNEEMQAALDLAHRITGELTDQGWPDPIITMSGNGAGLIWTVDLPNDEPSTYLVKRLLEHLATTYNTDTVKVDQSMFNAARIVKVIGTTARKGDNLENVLGLSDRPHRLSWMEAPKAEILSVPHDLLETFVATAKTTAPTTPKTTSTTPSSNTTRTFDRVIGTVESVRSYLERHGVAVNRVEKSDQGNMIILEKCPITNAEGDTSVAVGVTDRGVISFHNKHDRGIGLKWADLREHLEPGFKVWSQSWQGTEPTDSQQNGTQEAEPETPRPAYVSAIALVDAFPTQREAIIEGLLRRGESGTLISAPKMWKSWLLTDIALSVATGRDILSKFRTQQGRVLYLDYELQPATLAKRIQKVAEASCIDLQELGDFLVIESLRGRRLDALRLGQYIEHIKPEEFNLIVLDPLYRMYPREFDENSNTAMAELFTALQGYAETLNVAILTVHHTSKGLQSEKSITDVGAGAGAQARAADCHLAIRQHNEPNAAVIGGVVRSFPPFEPFALRWVYPKWQSAPDLDPNDLKKPTARRTRQEKAPKEPPPPKWDVDQFVGAFISEQPRPRTKIIAEAKANGMSHRAAETLLQEAEGCDLVFRHSMGLDRRAHFATVPQPTLNTSGDVER